MDRKLQTYLAPTAILNFDHPTVSGYAEEVLNRVDRKPAAMAVALYYAVRDGIRYDPYSPFYLPEHYRASSVLKRGRGYCVGKAALLCTLGRFCDIPSRLGFATVHNHLASKQLIDFLGSNRFVYHGYVEFYIDDRWVKATPAFNVQLCDRYHVDPLDFNGREDSVFHEYNREDERYMEYLADHGTFPDVPVAAIVAAWEKEYGKQRVQGWIRNMEAAGERVERDFFQEEPG
jgi:transglutaminase-like putative cysteine protease